MPRFIITQLRVIIDYTGENYLENSNNHQRRMIIIVYKDMASNTLDYVHEGLLSQQYEQLLIPVSQLMTTVLSIPCEKLCHFDS